MHPPTQLTTLVGSVAKNVEQKEVDYTDLHARKVAQDSPVDDGSGKVEVWRVEDFKKVPVEDGNVGQFFGGDSYVVLYTYEKR